MKLTLAAILFAMIGTSAQAMESGYYTQKLGDGSVDVLAINVDGSMSLELTRQVGGPGGISKDGVVPYPTVCRVRQYGAIVEESNGYLHYQVRSVELADLTGLRDSFHCQKYVNAFNAMIFQGVRFALKTSEYTPVK